MPDIEFCFSSWYLTAEYALTTELKISLKTQLGPQQNNPDKAVSPQSTLHSLRR